MSSTGKQLLVVDFPPMSRLPMVAVGLCVLLLPSLGRAEPPTAVQQKLFFQTLVEGKPSRRPYYLSLPRPKEAMDGRTKYPMLVFLHGCVEGGDDHQNLFLEAIPLYLRDQPDYAKAYPFIFVCPQTPPGLGWETPDMVKFVPDLIESLKKEYPVDPDRVYLTGLSNGGLGTWTIAQARPDLFAAVAVVNGRAVNAEKAGTILRKVPAWVIVGAGDGNCVKAAEQMEASYKKAGGELVRRTVPGAHVIWDQAYLDPELYAWLLKHSRGGRVAATAPTSRPAEGVAANTADAEMKRASKLREAGDEVGAYNAYRSIAGRYKDTSAGAEATAAAGRLESAAGFHDRLKLRMDGDAAREMVNIARAYLAAGHKEKARESLQKAIDVWPATAGADEARKMLERMR